MVAVVVLVDAVLVLSSSSRSIIQLTSSRAGMGGISTMKDGSPISCSFGGMSRDAGVNSEEEWEESNHPEVRDVFSVALLLQL